MSDIAIKDAEQQHRQDIARALRAAADRIEKGSDFLGATFDLGGSEADWFSHKRGMVADIAASPDMPGAHSGVLVPVWAYVQTTEACPHGVAEFGPVSILDYSADLAPCALCQHDDDLRNHPRDLP